MLGGSRVEERDSQRNRVKNLELSATLETSVALNLPHSKFLIRRYDIMSVYSRSWINIWTMG